VLSGLGMMLEIYLSESTPRCILQKGPSEFKKLLRCLDGTSGASRKVLKDIFDIRAGVTIPIWSARFQPPFIVVKFMDIGEAQCYYMHKRKRKLLV